MTGRTHITKAAIAVATAALALGGNALAASMHGGGGRQPTGIQFAKVGEGLQFQGLQFAKVGARLYRVAGGRAHTAQ